MLKKILKRVYCGKKLNRRRRMKRQLSLKTAPKERPCQKDIIDKCINFFSILYFTSMLISFIQIYIVYNIWVYNKCINV